MEQIHEPKGLTQERMAPILRRSSVINKKKTLVEVYDEADWNELMLTDLWEPFEDGKAFLRVN